MTSRTNWNPVSSGRMTTGRPVAKQTDHYLVLGLALVVGLFVVSLFTGVYDIFGTDDGLAMFAMTRIPRSISLVLAGASMAMCGLVMQLLTQNRFVEPTTTGTTEWAGLGLLGTLIVWPDAPVLAKMAVASFTAFVGTGIFFVFLRRVSLRTSLMVPIVGLMLGAVVGSISTFLALKFNLLQNLGVWFAGSFTAAIQGQYEVLWLALISGAGIVWAADRFTVAGLGNEVATNVGMNYERTVLLGVLLVSFATGVVTVAVGFLPFIGLIVPNVVSMIRGDDLRSNLPWVALAGIALVMIADLIGRTIIMPFEIPVSLILGIAGSAFFVVILLKRRIR